LSPPHDALNTHSVRRVREQGEEPIDCAARETLEECGYDAAGRLNEQDSFSVVHNSKLIKMYIVPDVPEDFHFEPQVRPLLCFQGPCVSPGGWAGLTCGVA
jgi:8-oxo-dGTP pyrophosphatase MutT (NUDIX family)